MLLRSWPCHGCEHRVKQIQLNATKSCSRRANCNFGENLFCGKDNSSKAKGTHEWLQNDRINVPPSPSKSQDLCLNRFSWQHLKIFAPSPVAVKVDRAKEERGHGDCPDGRADTKHTYSSQCSLTIVCLLKFCHLTYRKLMKSNAVDPSVVLGCIHTKSDTFPLIFSEPTAIFASASDSENADFCGDRN